MKILRTMTKNHNPKKNVNTEIFTYQRLPTEVSGDPENKLLSAANKIKNKKTEEQISCVINEIVVNNENYYYSNFKAKLKNYCNTFFNFHIIT